MSDLYDAGGMWHGDNAPTTPEELGQPFAMSASCTAAGGCLCRCKGGCGAGRHCNRHGHGCHMTCRLPTTPPRRGWVARALTGAALVAAGITVSVLAMLAGMLLYGVSVR